jgi:hypothetical protein
VAETELPWIFTEPLEREQIVYMIVGAFATMAFGVNRTTEDLDLVLGISRNDLPNFERAFPEEDFYRPPRETLLDKTMRPERGHFNLVHHATVQRADCYLVGQSPLQFWALKNKRRIEFEGRGCWVAPPELVILKKLEFFREGGSSKHPRDIRNLLDVVEIDRNFIEGEVKRMGLTQEWSVCQQPSGE